MSRNWAADLWDASFKGVPFWVEKDEDDFGKRLVIHEFVGRDDPFIEDLGAKARTYNFVAYFVGDTADIEADGFVATLLGTGPGNLVLPAQGPVNARFHEGKRSREKDKAGYFAFQIKFYQEGSAFALQPVDFLGQLVFDANDAMIGIATSLLDTVVLL